MSWEEYFYSVTLSDSNPTATWDPKELEDELPNAYKLIIKQILLGRPAKDGEYNVIQVETTSLKRELVKVPIAVLKAGETRYVRLELEFPDPPVTFKLIEGSGPVYIHGHHIPSTHIEDFEDNMEEMVEEEYFDEEEADDDGETEGNQKKKRKLSHNSKGNKVVAAGAKNNKKK